MSVYDINGTVLSGGNADYVLPVGGDKLGGVKNGGNVVINADGTMTAPEGGSVPDEQIQTAVETYLTENPVTGGGLTDRAKELLITILMNVPFTSEQEDNITQLATELEASGNADYEAWDYEWNCADGVPMTSAGWSQFTAYAGFVTSFDATTGQKLAIVEPQNTSVFGGLTLTGFATATEAVCEAVVNFDRVDQGEFIMSITDGTNLAALRKINADVEYGNNNKTEGAYEAGVDYKIRIESNVDSYRILVNDFVVYESTTFIAMSGVWHKWGNAAKTMLCVGAPECAVNIKSYKYKVVTA